MSEPLDLPRLPEDRLDPPSRKVGDLKPGERAVLNVITNIEVDEEGHVWVDLRSTYHPNSPASFLSMQAERTEHGFILWLSKNLKFTRSRLYGREHFLPVVEFREAPEKGKG